MGRQIETVAIVGGGPAGAALGCLLAQKGYGVGIFHSDKRPPLIVGESLIPAVVPMLRALGVEEEVKAFSVHKPGATVCLNVKEVIPAFFCWAAARLPDYAYNTPRDLFDAAILKAADKAGAKIFRKSAKLEKGSEPGTVRLSDETLEAAGGLFGKKPDFIVDASGRVRATARLLEIPEKRGGRSDVALFAHLDKSFISDPGNIHLDYLTKGWSWRIPLPQRVSVGVVIKPEHLNQYGDSVEKQYDAFLREEPSLRFYTEGAVRLTPVVKYQNYQLISEKICGPGWAAIGDAAGFTDPIFSSGLYLAMKSAFELMKAIESNRKESMRMYEEGVKWELKMWQRVIDSWYNGRLFNMYRATQKYQDSLFARAIARRARKRVIRILMGQAVDRFFNIQVFEYLTLFGTLLRNPADMVVV